ncbi:MAG: DUF4160 domain-containing protein [Cyanobacteria bacterium J06627_28]
MTEVDVSFGLDAAIFILQRIGMAEIFRKDGVVVLIQARDHHPPHVHVKSADYSVRVRIDKDEPSILPYSKKSRDKSCAAFDKLALAFVKARLEICK